MPTKIAAAALLLLVSGARAVRQHHLVVADLEAQAEREAAAVEEQRVGAAAQDADAGGDAQGARQLHLDAAGTRAGAASLDASGAAAEAEGVDAASLDAEADGDAESERQLDLDAAGLDAEAGGDGLDAAGPSAEAGVEARGERRVDLGASQLEVGAEDLGAAGRSAEADVEARGERQVALGAAGQDAEAEGNPDKVCAKRVPGTVALKTKGFGPFKKVKACTCWMQMTVTGEVVIADADGAAPDGAGAEPITIISLEDNAKTPDGKYKCMPPEERDLRKANRLIRKALWHKPPKSIAGHVFEGLELVGEALRFSVAALQGYAGALDGSIEIDCAKRRNKQPELDEACKNARSPPNDDFGATLRAIQGLEAFKAGGGRLQPYTYNAIVGKLTEVAETLNSRSRRDGLRAARNEASFVAEELRKLVEKLRPQVEGKVPKNF